MTREEILKEFKGVEGINEAKKIYKKLAKKLHPDVGGDEESFKILNAVYTDLIEHKIYFSNDFKIASSVSISKPSIGSSNKIILALLKKARANDILRI